MKIGFIGLGIMGRPMVENMLKAGLDVMVSDLNEKVVKEVASEGATPGTYEDLAKSCDVVEMILPKAAIVKDVIFGENGLVNYLEPGKIVVDHSSVTAGDSRECYDKLSAKGISFLDAPVSGGESGAKEGTLSIMVGGDEDVFNKCKEIFLTYGSQATLIGGPGSGSICKLANQIIVNNNIAIVAEALTFATKAGVDPEKVYKAIESGAARSYALEDKAPMMVSRNFKPGGTIKVNHKDITNVINTAHEIDCPIPYTAQLYEIQQTMKAHGHMEEDHSAYVKYFEKLADVTVKKGGDDGSDK